MPSPTRPMPPARRRLIRAAEISRSPGAAGTALVLAVAIVVLSTFTFEDPNRTANTVVAGPSSGTDTFVDVGPGDELEVEQEGTGGREASERLVGGTEGSDASVTGDATGGAEGGPQAAAGSAECEKGENAGDTAPGVSAKEIRLGATVVRTGIAKSFLADAQFGIEAVRRKVNAAGGICGRLLQIDYKDDGWVPSTGQEIIQKWIGEGNHFGLIVNPSSEGLRTAISSELIKQSQFPVMGADGQLIGQYKDPWVWPVATSTHSVMHIMAKNAIDRGAKTFAIVWESNFRFGVEGHSAFKKYVERHCGSGCVVKDTEIQGGGESYQTQANEFVGACKDGGVEFKKCDFVAVLLEPATAAQWVKANGLGSGDNPPKVGVGAPQPLFVNDFVRDNCGKPCAEMWVWTSFKPPIAPYDAESAVKQYVDDIRAVSASADVNNPHVQGAYVGALLAVKALEQLGPAPTREGVKQVLDQMSFESGLSKELKFSGSNHFAALSAQAFEAVYNVTGSSASFNGWRYAETGFIDDDEYQKDQAEQE
ncbi:MAG: ABC transporter substrate-binding protein [Actinobacteria bacterium]|nr:ABC transporter substrate-binding protein [Actinomycetota bacterium]